MSGSAKWLAVIVMGAALFAARPSLSRFFGPEQVPHSSSVQAANFDITESFDLLSAQFKTFVAQIGAAFKKGTSADVQLTQAGMNYDADGRVQEAAMEASAKFGSEVDADRYCNLQNQQAEADMAKDSAHFWAKAETSRRLATGLSPGTTGQRIRRMLEDHAEKYCSDKDALRGRCTPDGGGMQNADVKFSTLYYPNESHTLSDEERDAAKRFVDNVTNPIPREVLARSSEDTIEGRAYLYAQRTDMARFNLAQRAFDDMLARRRTREGDNPSGF